VSVSDNGAHHFVGVFSVFCLNELKLLALSGSQYRIPLRFREAIHGKLTLP